MSKNKLPKWTTERTEDLVDFVGDISPVPADTVKEAAERLETTTRSIGAKLRKLGYEVESTTTLHKKSFTEEQEQALYDFVVANEGEYTFAEIAIKVFGDADMSRKVQGKLLSMDMSSYAKPTPKKESQKTYTEEEEAVFEKMANDGAFLEDIAEALNRPLNSVRGKALSMMRSHGITIPKQKTSHASNREDIFASMDNLAEMTVAEIAEAVGKTERGIKTILTGRGISVRDHDGAARRAKADAAKAAKLADSEA